MGKAGYRGSPSFSGLWHRRCLIQAGGGAPDNSRGCSQRGNSAAPGKGAVLCRLGEAQQLLCRLGGEAQQLLGSLPTRPPGDYPTKPAPPACWLLLPACVLHRVA